MQIGDLNIQGGRKTVVFCLPGNSFSNNFLMSWSSLLLWCTQNNIDPVISCRQSSNVYFVRSMCLGADVRRGEFQVPFDEQVDYDYIMWIDSDQVFNPEQFQKLLSHDKDIVSGLYLMASGKQFPCVINWDQEYYQKNGKFYFITPKDIEGATGLIECAYNGMGFMLIKKGVFEKLEYPWFKGIDHDLGEGIVEFSSEDVSFCTRIREKGFKIFVDPTVIVGHEKSVII